MNLIEIQTATIDAVKNASSIIKEAFGKISTQDIETKSLNSLVTYVDKETELSLVAQLKNIVPEASFLTEEATIECRSSDWQWIIDPLDGTTNFIHRVPVFGISVALAYKNEIQVAVVYEPNRDECFYASKNNGASLNGQAINVSATTQLSDSLLATGFPYYDYEQTDQYLALMKELMQNTRGIRRLGAAAIDLCYTANGIFDGFFEYSLSPWDVAAGSLIVQEAGGKVCDFNGGNDYLFGRSIIATNATIYNEFYNSLKKYF
ncbi:MAG: inositol monophosphatase family protein [Chitinophagales bacterium]